MKINLFGGDVTKVKAGPKTQDSILLDGTTVALSVFYLLFNETISLPGLRILLGSMLFGVLMLTSGIRRYSYTRNEDGSKSDTTVVDYTLATYISRQL